MSGLTESLRRALTEAFNKRDHENDFDPSDMLKLHTALLNCVSALDRIALYRPPKLKGYGPNVGENAVAVADEALAGLSAALKRTSE